MAITSVTGLEEVNPVNCTPVLVKITSNLPAEEKILNYLRIDVDGPPNYDETIQWTHNGVTVSFIVRVAADDSGTQLSQQGALSIADYTTLLVEEINANYLAFLYFEVTEQIIGLDYWIKIEPRENKDLDITFESTLNNLFTTLITSTNPNYQENTSMALLVEIYDEEEGVYNPPLPHILPLLETSVPVVFDIQKDFNLRHQLPNPLSIGLGSSIIAGCTDNWTKFKISYGERIGSTPIVQGITSEPDPYYAIYAGKNYLDQFDSWWTFWRYSDLFLTNQPRPKTVTMIQPEWLYWVGRSEVLDAKIKVVSTMRDDTTATEIKGEYDISLGEVIYIKAGFYQLGLVYNPSNPIVSYTVQLVDDEENEISEAFEFQLTADCLEWERYYLFGNSVGGCDTVRGTGKVAINLDTEAQEARRLTTAEVIDNGRGQEFQYNKRQRSVYEGSIGYKPIAYILYLRDMLLSNEVWAIDVEDQSFVPILVNNGSVRFFKDGEDLYTLRWQYRLAYEDCSVGFNKIYSGIIVTSEDPDTEVDVG